MPEFIKYLFIASYIVMMGMCVYYSYKMMKIIKQRQNETNKRTKAQ